MLTTTRQNATVLGWPLAVELFATPSEATVSQACDQSSTLQVRWQGVYWSAMPYPSTSNHVFSKGELAYVFGRKGNKLLVKAS